MEYNPAFSNASPALGMLCPPHAALWITSESNARFHLCRTGDLHKFCNVTVGKRFCFYCMFYFSHGICALNLPKGVSSASSRVALVPTLTHLISVRRTASSVTSVHGWEIPPPASLCCAETALQPGFEKLNPWSRWNISSCQSQPRHFESMCLSLGLLHITIRCIATAL